MAGSIIVMLAGLLFLGMIGVFIVAFASNRKGKS